MGEVLAESLPFHLGSAARQRMGEHVPEKVKPLDELVPPGSLGPDGDVYLVGRVALEHLTVDELDRIIGVLYELTERWFQPVVQLAYGKRTRLGA